MEVQTGCSFGEPTLVILHHLECLALTFQYGLELFTPLSRFTFPSVCLQLCSLLSGSMNLLLQICDIEPVVNCCLQSDTLESIAKRFLTTTSLLAQVK